MGNMNARVFVYNFYTQLKIMNYELKIDLV